MINYELNEYSHNEGRSSTCYLTVTLDFALADTDDENAFMDLKKKMRTLLNDTLSKLENGEY